MIRAILYRDRQMFLASHLPGAIHFDLAGAEMALWFFCPCGCGTKSRISIGRDVKPTCTPSWEFRGTLNDPTLSPSVNQTLCGWHGWLRGGYWEAC